MVQVSSSQHGAGLLLDLKVSNSKKTDSIDKADFAASFELSNSSSSTAINQSNEMNKDKVPVAKEAFDEAKEHLPDEVDEKQVADDKRQQLAIEDGNPLPEASSMESFQWVASELPDDVSTDNYYQALKISNKGDTELEATGLSAEQEVDLSKTSALVSTGRQDSKDDVKLEWQSLQAEIQDELEDSHEEASLASLAPQMTQQDACSEKGDDTFIEEETGGVVGNFMQANTAVTSADEGVSEQQESIKIDSIATLDRVHEAPASPIDEEESHNIAIDVDKVQKEFSFKKALELVETADYSEANLQTDLETNISLPIDSTKSAQPTTSVAAPAEEGTILVPIDSPAWGKALSEQVVTQLQNGTSKAWINLHPDNLGAVKIELSMQASEAKISFASEHAHVRASVESALPELKENLAEKGVTLLETNIEQQLSGNSSRQDEGSTTHFAPVSHSQQDVVAVSAPVVNSSSRGDGLVDYYI